MLKDLKSPNDPAKNITNNANQHPLIEQAYFKHIYESGLKISYDVIFAVDDYF